MITLGRAGLFLDLDGTLADSLPVLRRVYSRFLAHFGYEGNDDEFYRLNGPKLTEIISELRTNYRLEMDAEKLLDLYDRLVDQAFTEVMPYPNSWEAVVSAFEKGWVVVVVTSNLGARTKRWLEQNRFSAYVTAVVSGEEVQRGKPWPDLYELAQARVATTRSLSLAVEDSVSGIRAAQAAGLRAIMFTPGSTQFPELPADTERMINWTELGGFLAGAPTISEKGRTC
jgi:beta-phosphoglucomutase-like phosphatase (HAD superfamily)